VEKKSVSPIIGSITLIALTILLGLILYYVVASYINPTPVIRISLEGKAFVSQNNELVIISLIISNTGQTVVKLHQVKTFIVDVTGDICYYSVKGVTNSGRSTDNFTFNITPSVILNPNESYEVMVAYLGVAGQNFLNKYTTLVVIGENIYGQTLTESITLKITKF